MYELIEISEDDSDYSCDESILFEIEEQKKDKNLEHFINFCIKKKLFKKTHFDWNNSFSILGTKIPDTFDKLSKKKSTIKKKDFINSFKYKYKYKGDIELVYSFFDVEGKNFISWEDFQDIFLDVFYE